MKDKPDVALAAVGRLDATVLELEKSAGVIKRFASLSRDSEAMAQGMIASVAGLEGAASELKKASSNLANLSLEAIRKELHEDRLRLEVRIEALSPMMEKANTQLRDQLMKELEAALDLTRGEIIDRQREIAKTVSTLQSHVTAEALSVKDDLRRVRELTSEAAATAQKRDTLLRNALIVVALLQVAVLVVVWLARSSG